VLERVASDAAKWVEDFVKKITHKHACGNPLVIFPQLPKVAIVDCRYGDDNTYG
jgi:hypothetical protein